MGSSCKNILDYTQVSSFFHALGNARLTGTEKI